jgi:glutamate synthase domain-containing protein 3
MTVNIDGKKLDFKKLNEKVHQAADRGAAKIVLKNVNGQRYIAAGLKSEIRIDIEGVPGNDLGAFMDGPQIRVFGNVQEAVGNTMNGGKIYVHGSAGDILGYAMRGGEIFVKGNVGYRAGIHMKAYRDMLPLIVIGGKAQDYLGEYMAGGILIVLGLSGGALVGDYVGTGMHGGVIYVRGEVHKYQLGKEVGIVTASAGDSNILQKYVKEFCGEFGIKYSKQIFAVEKFFKIVPVTHRPYGNLYAY